MMIPTVAVLGTGRMGAPIAGNLLAAGFPVVVWNRTAARAAPLVDDGARLAESPAAAAGGADVIVTMLADGEAVERVMTGADGALASAAPGSFWIQMATVGAAWTERLRLLARQAGVEFVDAPVSGSEGPARLGQLVVLASGPDHAHDFVAPVLDAVGRETLWLGEAGNGTRLKLVLNAWLAAQVEGAAEAIRLARALGADPARFVDVIARGPLGSPYAVAKARAMLGGEFTPGFSLNHALKDVRLAVSAGESRGTELALLELLAQRWERAAADGHGDEDVASVVAEPPAGPPLSRAA